MATRHRIKAGLCGATLALLAAFPLCRAGEKKSPALEDKVKTAFIYKFTHYIQWPETPAAENFTIAVIGDSGITAHLRELARQKTANGRTILVEQLKSTGTVGPCQILFVAAKEKERLPEIIKITEGKNTLIVGDSAGLALRGAAVNFVVVDGRLRFEINRGAAARAGLEISSELLKLAILVEEGGAKDVRP
ncbi:MAG: hypothetical protein A3J79_09965 [Elusimicrobia bacterium RIFOXYB2_FULL_62_6]|nr:MAG: hypothetical protein A3J79_09965 [Elusimicrobia bacterium RIFOXYB2_FULL_62_6]